MRAFFTIGALSILLFANDSFAEDPVAIPCLDAAGVVKNAQPADVCKALLPKCTEMKTKLVDQMKDMIAWKIYGYYHLGKDIKLDKLSGMTTGGANAVPEGDPLPYPICSVVGHKLTDAVQGEVSKQSIGLQQSCGEFPIFQNGSSWNYKVKIQYEGEKGKKWYSYVLGAYPWVMRRQASEVKKELKDDLSNLDQVIHTAAMTADVKLTLGQIKASTLALSADAKATCNLPQSTNVITACMTPGALSITDPVQKLCTLAKAHKALNDVALTNMLVYEVMDRSKKMHDQYFAKIFSANDSPSFAALIKRCGDNKSVSNTISSVLSPVGSILKNAIMANKSYSCNTSCMTDGEEWYTNTTDGDAISWKNTGSGQKQRKCKKSAYFDLNTGEPLISRLQTELEAVGWTKWNWNSGEPGWWSSSNENTAVNNITSNFGIGNSTKNVGFAGMIESIIRRDICKQAGNSKTGQNVCDDIAIGDKPAGK